MALGAALGPCTFEFLGPVIAVTMQVAGTRPVFAMLLLVLAYATGHCAVLAIAGALGPAIVGAASWESRSVTWLRQLRGAFVVAGGLYLVYAA